MIVSKKKSFLLCFCTSSSFLSPDSLSAKIFRSSFSPCQKSEWGKKGKGKKRSQRENENNSGLLGHRSLFLFFLAPPAPFFSILYAHNQKNKLQIRALFLSPRSLAFFFCHASLFSGALSLSFFSGPTRFPDDVSNKTTSKHEV